MPVLRISAKLILATAVVVGLWSAHDALAVGITSATAVPNVTTAEVTVKTDAPATVYWCISGYPIKKFFGTTSVTASCAGTTELENGWIPGGPTTIGNTITFTARHLLAGALEAMTIKVTEQVSPSTYTTASLNIQMLSKLAITNGPTVTNISTPPNSATQQWRVDWDTSRGADTRLQTTSVTPIWTSQSVVSDVLYSIANAGNSRSVAVGAAGRIVRSDNGGYSWTNVGSVTGQALYSVSAVDELTFWAVGNQGEVYLTTDGGFHWARIVTGENFFLRSVVTPTPTLVVAVGVDGQVLRSTDSGTSWSRITTPVSLQLEMVKSLGASLLWAVGEGGSIIKSVDGGQSWQNQSQAAGSFTDISIVSATSAFALTLNGEVWTTTNGGSSWVEEFSFNRPMSRIVVFSSGAGYAFGGGVVYVRAPAGGWTQQPNAVFSSFSPQGLAALSETNMKLVGDAGQIVNFQPDFLGGTSFVSPISTTAHSHTLSLACGNQFVLRARSNDFSTPQSTVAANDAVITTATCPDTQPPTVQFDSPTTFLPPVNGLYTSSAALTVRGQASDNPGGGVDTVRITHTPPTGTPTTVNSDPPLTGITPRPLSYAWSKGFTLQPGLNQFSVFATDIYANRSVTPDPTFSVTYDNADPTLAITSHTNNQFVTDASLPQITLAGTAGDNIGLAGITTQFLDASGNPIGAPATVDTPSFTGNPTSANWTKQLTLTGGVNRIRVVATDAAGRTATQTIILNYDTDTPIATITNHSSGECQATATIAPLTGTASDSSGIQAVRIRVNGGPAISATLSPINAQQVSWIVSSVSLQPGDNTIVVEVTDNSGKSNNSAHSITIRYGQQPPQIAFTTPNDGTVTTNPTVDVAGTTTTHPQSCPVLLVGVRVDPQSSTFVTATGTTNWSITQSLANGVNTIDAQVTDTAGRTVSAPTRRITLDNSDPQVHINALPNPVTSDPVTLTGTVDDNTAVQSITVRLNNVVKTGLVATPTLPATGSPANVSWTIDLTPLLVCPNRAPCPNRVEVSAVDNVGNVGTAALDFFYVPPDTTPPVIQSGHTVTTGVECSPQGSQVYIRFRWNTDEPADKYIEYSVNSAFSPSSVITQPIDPQNPTTHDIRAQGLQASTQYFWRFRSSDAAGNTSNFVSGNLTTADSCDIDPPVVQITQPPDGRVVSGTVSVVISATDNRQMIAVQLFVDGDPYGAMVNCNPIATCVRTVTWDTTQESEGEHILSAQGSDSAGLVGTAPDVRVRVDNTGPRVLASSVYAQPSAASGTTWQAIITWCTDDVSTSVVYYGPENLSDGTYQYLEDPATTEGMTPVDLTPPAPPCTGEFSVGHRVVLTDLEPNRRYHYMVESCDGNNVCGN